jgi:hypothetical protein
VVVPEPTAVASPDEAPIVAICVLLEIQLTALDKLTVAPEEVVPMARNCVVSPGVVND